MMSVVICSIKPDRFEAARRMYKAAFGDYPFEIVGIHDAASLAEGYNRGAAQCRGEFVIFSHDDIEILNDDFPQRLAKHLEKYDLVGVAGTDRLVAASWGAAGPSHSFGQVVHPTASGRLQLNIYGSPRRIVGNIQALDGLFMAARRSVLDRLAFDSATFDGFHFYDVDFSFQAYRAGLRVGVANDIHLLHHSPGRYDQAWTKYASRFERKWQGQFSQRIHLKAGRMTAIDVPNRASMMAILRTHHWEETASETTPSETASSDRPS